MNLYNFQWNASGEPDCAFHFDDVTILDSRSGAQVHREYLTKI